MALIGGAAIYVTAELGLPRATSVTRGDKLANEAFGWLREDEWLRVYFSEGVYAAPHGEWWDAQPKYPNRGKMKTNGKTGKKKRIYKWDGQHGGEVEEYNSNGEHLGVRDPQTGKRIKPAVKGRRIKDEL